MVLILFYSIFTSHFMCELHYNNSSKKPYQNIKKQNHFVIAKFKILIGLKG